MSHRLLSLALFTTAIVLPSPSQVLNQNLVQNPGAEDGPSAALNFTDAQVIPPSWTTTGGFSVAAYDGGDLLSTSGDFIPLAHGKRFFYGGPGLLREPGFGCATRLLPQQVDGGGDTNLLEQFLRS